MLIDDAQTPQGSEEQPFHWHPSIVDTMRKGWDLEVNGKSLSQGLRLCEYEDRRVYRGGVDIGAGGVVKFAAVVYPGGPLVDFYFWLVFGHTKEKTPQIARRASRVVTVGKAGGDIVVDLDDGSGFVLNGQGTPPRIRSYDFSTGEWDVARPLSAETLNYEGTDYARVYGNSTGGHWKDFGLTHPIKSFSQWHWRRELYALGNLPGNLLEPTGRFAAEPDYPDSMLDGGNYFHQQAPGWIEYSDPKNPWKDKACFDIHGKDRWQCQDNQHLAAYNPLSQAWLEWPDDEGFRWLTMAAATRFLFQVEGENKGTCQYDPGQARARGRILLTGWNLWKALNANGEKELAAQVSERTTQRLFNQIVEFRAEMQRGLSPLVKFAYYGGYSPGEHGIWWWGLMRMYNEIPKDQEIIPEIEFMMKFLSRYLFNSWTWWDIPGDRHWAVPYWNNPPNNSGNGPSSMGHFAWLGAVSSPEAYEPKLSELKALGEGMDARWKG